MARTSLKNSPQGKKFLLATIVLLSIIAIGAGVLLSKQTKIEPDPRLQAFLEPLFRKQDIQSSFTVSQKRGFWSQGLLVELKPSEDRKKNHGKKEVLLLPLAIAGYHASFVMPGLDRIEVRSTNQDEDVVRAETSVKNIRRFVEEKQDLDAFAKSVDFEVVAWEPTAAGKKDRARQYLERGRVFANEKGNYDKALSLFEQAEALAPGDYDVQFALAMTHWALGRNDEAIRRLEKTRDAYPQEYRTYPAMARCLLSANRRQEAAAALAKFDSLRPAGPGPYPQAALFQAAQAYIDLANIRRAVELLKDYIGLYPDHAEGHYLLGKIYFASGDKKQAMAAFRRAASLGPDDPRTCQDLGWHLATLKDLLPAATAYRRSYTLGNRDVNVFVGLSYCYDRLGKYFDAKHVVIEGMKRFPNNTDLEKNFRSIHRTIVKRGLRPSAAPTPIELTEG